MTNNMIKISAVSYLNTLPFLYGIKNSSVLKDFVFQLDIPSVCASKLIKNEVDIALIPVAAIPSVKNPYFISDYCLGAKNKVRTVLLLSDVPLQEIESVLLDYQSRTSVNLVKILASKLWEINPEWIDAKVGFENEISGTTAGVVIGDRAFTMSHKYQYVFDLSEEWHKLTKLPFVFATWLSNKPIKKEFIDTFNQALKFGIDNVEAVVSQFYNTSPDSKIDLEQYLTSNIDFVLDNDKKQSIKLFYEYLVELGLLPTNIVNHLTLFPND
jgi:chorismate dehydratase